MNGINTARSDGFLAKLHTLLMNDVLLLKSGGLEFIVYKYFVNSVVITKEVCLEKEYGII